MVLWEEVPLPDERPVLYQTLRSLAQDVCAQAVQGYRVPPLSIMGDTVLDVADELLALVHACAQDSDYSRIMCVNPSFRV